MEPANLLFLFSDEHDPRYLGCSGHPFVRTPNLDRLAAGGTRFANAWTPSPICVPARAALATGRYVHDIGYWDNAIAYDGRVRGWGHRLQAEGMRVESIGKLHYRNGSDPTGFDRQQEPMHIMGGVGLIWAAVRDPMPDHADRSPLFDELGEGTSSYNRYDLRITELAIEWLEARAARPDGRPWMLFVGLVAPHMPFMVPRRYLDLYPPDRLPLPKLLPRDGYRRHPWIERYAKHWDHDASLGTDERRRLAIASYLGLITFLDENIGRVLAALERTGLARSTRVVYASDHGDNLGTRGLWNKCVPYRESTGIPMIVAGPGVPAGRVCRTNASLVDVYPTVLDNMGLAAEGDERTLPGRSLLDLARSADDAGRAGFSEYHAVGAQSGGFMLTRGRYKYHHYVGFAPELFDLETDPEETSDLAADPAHAPILREFETRLRSMLDPEAVDRQAKDAQNALVARHGGPDAVRHMGNPGSTPTPDKFR
ncbi:MAG: sulfatase-like hydrolase/transferase [Burkholderiales bacterium]